MEIRITDQQFKLKSIFTLKMHHVCTCLAFNKYLWKKMHARIDDHPFHRYINEPTTLKEKGWGDKIMVLGSKQLTTKFNF